MQEKSKPITLGNKQEIFSQLVPILINFIHEQGYKIRIGEVYRPPEMAAIYAERGLGIKNSAHTNKLAIDINLFLNEQYLTKTEDHRKFGEFWEKLGPKYGVETAWGGRFNDGNHYSIVHNGVK